LLDHPRHKPPLPPFFFWILHLDILDHLSFLHSSVFWFFFSLLLIFSKWAGRSLLGRPVPCVFFFFLHLTVLPWALLMPPLKLCPVVSSPPFSWFFPTHAVTLSSLLCAFFAPLTLFVTCFAMAAAVPPFFFQFDFRCVADVVSHSHSARGRVQPSFFRRILLLLLAPGCWLAVRIYFPCFLGPFFGRAAVPFCLASLPSPGLARTSSPTPRRSDLPHAVTPLLQSFPATFPVSLHLFFLDSVGWQLLALGTAWPTPS